jgi:hypothetical protein
MSTFNPDHVDSTSERHEIWETDARLLRGTNSPANVALTAWLLGIVVGLGLFVAVVNWIDWSTFGAFAASLGTFHLLEYLCTALYNPGLLTWNCTFFMKQGS